MPHPPIRQHRLPVACIAIACAITLLSCTRAEPEQAAALRAETTAPGRFAGFAHGQAFDAAGTPIRLDGERILAEQLALIQGIAKSLPDEEQAAASQLQRALHDASSTVADRIISQAAMAYWMLDRIKTPDVESLRQLNAGLLFSYPRSAAGLPEDPEFWLNLSKGPRELLEREKFKWPWTLYTPPPPTRYMQDCLNAGVPLPPDWGDPAWLPNGEQNLRFLTVDTPRAEVYYYVSKQPEGLCMSLPRSTGNTISTLQIICQGKQSSRACFWDNRVGGVQQTIQWGERRSIREFTGGDNITRGGENCSDCHAGFNAFVVHPGTAVDLTPLGINMQPDKWYTPLISLASPQNPGPETALERIPLGTASIVLYTPLGGWFPWVSIENVPERSCVACHKLPQLSTFTTPKYCNSILPQAVDQTMPPAPDPVHAGWEKITSRTDLAFEKHINALRQACGLPPAPRDISAATWLQ